MKILVTAGATIVPIDQVRAIVSYTDIAIDIPGDYITNIFRGRTGTNIAQYLSDRGIEVVLITSNPDLVQSGSRLKVIPYKTYQDLFAEMLWEITSFSYDVVIHSAAVSDYEVAGVMINNQDGTMEKLDNGQKVCSTHDKLYIELRPTKKIIDLIRTPAWGSFKGKLVKFKLEVGRSDEELLAIATRSVQASQADLIIANCLEWYGEKAYLVDPNGSHQLVPRKELSQKIWERIQ